MNTDNNGEPMDTGLRGARGIVYGLALLIPVWIVVCVVLGMVLR